ncbi:non-hydrolyzing UDP-N-acetylglucosamine 2-epimerase [Trinickia mobilis]|uniref:non-hydrolyzing UDP-N-acetylglucosamine 2-epimerase n=1 Tax=Trinickia mobilis TaxID=2816356 RepID=UPI001A8EF12E|nr:UDP-N-acetylglucosamine 2-epimerase (non-hydrolyzing) [Trinickia mobilis]
MKKILTVVGARPQFIKAAAVSRALAEGYASKLTEIMVHTGQHYDNNMSQVFFDELGIPEPAHNLEISGGTHGVMTGRMLEGIERVMLSDRPDVVLIYGDTNSTLAGALAAVKLHIPVAHVEAGLRSFNMRMPEEVNRIVADRVSSLLFCPTETAVRNLANEGIVNGVSNVGDVMYDVSLHYAKVAVEQSKIAAQLGVTDGRYVLATCHRAENTDDPKRMRSIAAALGELAKDIPVVLPLHPRTRQIVANQGLLDLLGDVQVVEPLSFLDMVRLEQSAKVILTDSGGVQKEAFFYGVPCVTMRDETEWVETVSSGWNVLVGADKDKLLAAVHEAAMPAGRPAVYGDGRAAEKILAQLV